MRAVTTGLIAGLGLIMAVPCAFAEPVTTRIETRPFYGATVTLEEGVRVFRPLPSHDRVVINPGGQTPVSLNFSEARNYSFNEYAGEPAPVIGRYGPAYYGAFGNMLPRRHHHHGRPGHRHGPKMFPRR
jgi:hypothetical protein